MSYKWNYDGVPIATHSAEATASPSVLNDEVSGQRRARAQPAKRTDCEKFD